MANARINRDNTSSVLSPSGQYRKPLTVEEVHTTVSAVSWQLVVGLPYFEYSEPVGL